MSRKRKLWEVSGVGPGAVYMRRIVPRRKVQAAKKELRALRCVCIVSTPA